MLSPIKSLDSQWKWEHERELQSKSHLIGPSGEKQFVVIEIIIILLIESQVVTILYLFWLRHCLNILQREFKSLISSCLQLINSSLWLLQKLLNKFSFEQN